MPAPMHDAAASGLPPQDAADLDSDVGAVLYRELHRIAAARMRHERPSHTLQATALVNEAYLRIAAEGGSIWQDRPRVLGLAAHIMRNILVDHARAHRAGKRGAGAVQVTFNDPIVGTQESVVDVLAIHDALTALDTFDPRQASIVELRFFGGLTFEEIATQLDVSVRTAKRDWTMARAWLRTQLMPNP